MFESEESDKPLEIFLIGIWILVILVLFFLFNQLFLSPLNEAEKRNAEEQMKLRIDNNKMS